MKVREIVLSLNASLWLIVGLTTLMYVLSLADNVQWLTRILLLGTLVLLLVQLARRSGE